MTAPTDRHLDIPELQRCLSLDVPVEFPIDGTPPLRVFIDPYQPAVGIRCPDDGSRPTTDLEHVEVRTVHRDKTRQLEVLVTEPELFLDAYPALCAMADRIQLHGVSVASAVADTLRLLGKLLHRLDRLPVEAELGLFGELLLLHGLCETVGRDEAISAWLGPDAEEHDFSLRGIDIETKTTRGERRTHWISSLTQLDPHPGSPLWLVSHQLTPAGPGSGHTLPELVDLLRALLGKSAQRARFDELLHQAGWHDASAGSLRTRWRRRAPSLGFHVDDGFPRLTPNALHHTAASRAHILDVRYHVDLSRFSASPDIPAFLATALSSEVLK